ncbi:hypothetical protein MST22_04985 [Virgibacillus halodenitrificans]|nr:hypothetical protein [Virgibacillus halodenitrificans]MCJ0930503.1 hypothetical protein [Virgibacillus halodenitrificans]
MKHIISPIPIVGIMLLIGERRFIKINIGKMVSETNVKRPGIVILCFVPQLLQSIGL